MPRIHGLIDEAKRVPSIRQIVFTGGECFLLGRDLDALIAHAHEQRFETRVVTNGYWAVDGAAARKRVSALRAAGLREMMLSTGTFHQRFVPLRRVIDAARAATSAGIACRISVEDCDQQTFDDSALREELAAEATSAALVVSRAPWIPDAGGRGEATLTHDAIRRSPAGTQDAAGRCPAALVVLAVTPDQMLTACCGFPLEELPALRIGSLVDTALDELIERAPSSLLQMWLHVAGPAGIAQFVARYIPGYKLPGDSVSICQACTLLQTDERAMRVVREHAGEVVQGVVEEFVGLQEAFSPAG